MSAEKSRSRNQYRILIVGRGSYFERICGFIQEKLESECEVNCIALPVELPPFIDNPEDFLDSKEFEHTNLVISATQHPDLALHLAEFAVKAEIEVLVYGCTENLSEQRGLVHQIEEICNDKVRVFMPPTVCALKLSQTDKETSSPFFEKFGFPIFKIQRKNNQIINIFLEQGGAVCGSSDIVVKELIRNQISADKLVEKAGLFAQIGCLAGGQGTQKGTIYKGAKVHAVAMKTALKEVNK